MDQFNQIILPEVKKERTPEEKVEEALVKAAIIYRTQFNYFTGIELKDTVIPILEIAKMILQVSK